MVAGALADVADAWADAPASLRAGYVATFDVLDDTSGAVFVVAWAALALFGLLYSVAIHAEARFPRWLTPLCAASAATIIAGLAIGFAFQADAAFVLLLLGLLLQHVVILVIGLDLWRLADTPASAQQRPVAAFASSSNPTTEGP